MGTFAFYAPMKPPSHPTPSGDRQMARALMAALADGASGERVDLVSELRIYDGKGDAKAQIALQQRAEAEADRLISQGTDWQAWITYHNYYKAPDIIGPRVSRALNIPYIQIESTRSKKRLNGPWSRFAALSEAACDHADLVFYFTDRDFTALKNHKPSQQTLTKLQPFLPRTTLPNPAPLNSQTILSVAMFRPGDKLASYKIIADILPQLNTPNWRLDIAGDGPGRVEIEAMFAPFEGRVRFLGQLDEAGLGTAYQNAAILLWPGVNEAFGIVYLEAQAAGVPVLAQDRPGVCDVVHPDGLVQPGQGPRALAKALDALLHSSDLRQSRGQSGRSFIAKDHLLDSARQTLLNGIALIRPNS